MMLTKKFWEFSNSSISLLRIFIYNRSVHFGIWFRLLRKSSKLPSIFLGFQYIRSVNQIQKTNGKKSTIPHYLLRPRFNHCRFPVELQDKIEREQFEYTIKMMNSMYAEAGKANCSTFCEGCMACMVSTSYPVFL